MSRVTAAVPWALFGAGTTCLVLGAIVSAHENRQASFLSAVYGRPVGRDELRASGQAVCVPRALALRHGGTR